MIQVTYKCDECGNTTYDVILGENMEDILVCEECKHLEAISYNFGIK